MVNLNIDDIIIRRAVNGWIVFYINDEGEPVDTYVFENNDYTAVGQVIRHVFEDHTQLKRRGGFVLDWYPEGWEHPEGRPESANSESLTEAVDINPEIVKKFEV